MATTFDPTGQAGLATDGADDAPAMQVGHVVDARSALLVVDRLRVEFRLRQRVIVANDSVSYSVNNGETLAIIGESGSGKSVSAMAVMGIIDSPPGHVVGGRIVYRGVDLLQMRETDRRAFRGEQVAMIFQDALTALNPVLTVGKQIGEMFRVHRGTSAKQAKLNAIELLDRVRIPGAAARIDNYPHEFSGGMRQRVMIAMAIALDPSVLIADEPTTALDVTVQAQVMDLLAELQTETGMGLILITHDLGVVAEVADRAAVMYAGRIVETGAIDDIYSRPSHPYTAGLMRSLPTLEARTQRLEPIPGTPPDLAQRTRGCVYRPRCELAKPECEVVRPELIRVGVRGHHSACMFPTEVRS